MNVTEQNNLKNLSQFSGTERYYRHWTRKLTMTDGTQFLCENGAAWLIDIVASYQLDPKFRKNQKLREFQLWELVRTGSTAVVTCREDSNKKPVIEQHIEHTDFPLDKITLYVEPSEIGPVCLLPSEH